MKLDVSVIAYLEHELGPTLVAVATGLKGRLEECLATVAKWLDGTAKPEPEQEKRLEFMYEQFQRVASVDGTDIARLWFTGANVGEDELAPFQAMRNGDLDGVRISAGRMVEGTHGY